MKYISEQDVVDTLAEASRPLTFVQIADRLQTRPINLYSHMNGMLRSGRAEICRETSRQGKIRYVLR